MELGRFLKNSPLMQSSQLSQPLYGGCTRALFEANWTLWQMRLIFPKAFFEDGSHINEVVL